ncbi:MAG: hypothetical protein ACJ748_03050, partial [Flavisolibacter sp.]
TYYMRRGKFCMRRRTSLNKERILSDPAFKSFRNCSTQFGESSLLATSIYKQLPKKKRKHGVIGKLTGQVYKLIRAGMSRKKILCKIISEYFGIVSKKKEMNGTVTYSTMQVADSLLLSTYLSAHPSLQLSFKKIQQAPGKELVLNYNHRVRNRLSESN